HGEGFGVERVQPGGDQAAERVRQLVDAAGAATLVASELTLGPRADESHQLLEEERVAATSVQQDLAHRRWREAAGQRFEQLLGRLPVERVDVQDEVVVPTRLR